MTDIKHSSHDNSFDSNYMGIFDKSESMLDTTTKKAMVRDDTQYDDPHSSELVDFDKERNPFSMGGDNLDDMPEIPSREIATPPKRYVADERTVQSFDDILKGDLRKRVLSVESELDQDRIDMEMAAIAQNLDNRHMSFDDIGLDHSDLNPDDIDIDFRPQSDSESDELSYGKVDATKNSMPPPLGSTTDSVPLSLPHVADDNLFGPDPMPIGGMNRLILQDDIVSMKYKELQAFITQAGLSLPEVCSITNLFRHIQQHFKWREEGSRTALYVDGVPRMITFAHVKKGVEEYDQKHVSQERQKHLRELSLKNRLTEEEFRSLEHRDRQYADEDMYRPPERHKVNSTVSDSPLRKGLATSDNGSFHSRDKLNSTLPRRGEAKGEGRGHVLEEIQGRWTAADQSINVAGDSVVFNGESHFQVFEMDAETLKLVMDDMDWWYKSNGNLMDEIIWVNLQDMRIKWTRVKNQQVPAFKNPNLPPIEVASPKTDITTDDEVVRAISDRRKKFTDPVIVEPPSAVARVDSTNSTPQRTPRSARGQIDKLRSIIEAQKMEIQELQDKLKEKSSREVNLLQNEIDALKRELKLRDDDVFHFKSAYQELKVQMEKQSRSLPLRSLSENRKVEDPYYNQYKGNNYLKPNKANSDLGNYSTQSEPNFARRSPKELQIARANVQLREKVAEKNDFIHRLLNIQEDGLARLLRDENSSLANENMSHMKADLDEMKKTKQDPVVSPNSTGHHRHASIGSFFEDKGDNRVNRLESEVLRLNQKINIIKHETQTNPRMKRVKIAETPPRPYREKKSSASADYEDKRNPYKKRSRPRSQTNTRTSHKRYRSLGSGKTRSYTPHVHEITTTKSAPRHRSLTAERTSSKSPASRSAPVKSFRIDVYEDSENGSNYQIESPERGISAISNPERASGMYRNMKTQHKSEYKTEQKARINRIRKRFQKEQRKSKNYASSYQSSSPSKNWYVQSVA